VNVPSVVFEIRPINDRPFLEDLLRLRWSGGSILLRGKLIAPADVDGLAAYDNGHLAGVATWRLEGPVIYLVTLNNITEQRGVGMALLDAIKKLGREKGSALMRVIVTNDNLNALGFYQRRGFRMVALHPGAIDMIRAMKPSIPLMGHNHIQIRDEIELETDL
jgi:GNAT superfamily N-acetyltransferase